jgi:hypothetical protein
MADPILDVRLVVATFKKSGRATFNQVSPGPPPTSQTAEPSDPEPTEPNG